MIAFLDFQCFQIFVCGVGYVYSSSSCHISCCQSTLKAFPFVVLGFEVWSVEVNRGLYLCAVPQPHEAPPDVLHLFRQCNSKS